MGSGSLVLVRRQHRRSARRCTPLRCLLQARCPSYPLAAISLAPATSHRPQAPSPPHRPRRRRLTAPALPDGATRPAPATPPTVPSFPSPLLTADFSLRGRPLGRLPNLLHTHHTSRFHPTHRIVAVFTCCFLTQSVRVSFFGQSCLYF